MSYSTCPVCKFAVEQYCSEKDAEIERLKALVETLRAANASFEGGMHWRNGLITELCDALDGRKRLKAGSIENWRTHWENIDVLLQRAREATK
jgi:hypothetical protein